MTEKRLIGVYGTGGFGREVMPFVRNKFGSTSQLVFIDDRPSEQIHCREPVVSLDAFIKIAASDRMAVLAVGDGETRKALASRCKSFGIELPTMQACNALVFDNVVMGMGAVLCPFSLITSDVVIGELFQANIYAYVAHDCRIGNCVTLAPGAKVNGNVHIGDDVYVGTGAIIRHGTQSNPVIIGSGAVIGMGAVVTKNVPPRTTVVGNPARVIG